MNLKKVWLLIGTILSLLCAAIILLGLIHIYQTTIEYSTPIELRQHIMFFALFGEISFIGGILGYLSHLSFKRYNRIQI